MTAASVGWIASACAGPAEFSNPTAVYEALTAGPAQTIQVTSGSIRLVYGGPMPESEKPLISAWIKTASDAVTAYFGAFPVNQVGLLIVPTEGRRVAGGTTWGFQGPAIKLNVGTETRAGAFGDDWQLVHEFVHLSFPQMVRTHHWLEEGIATYVEPIARIQAGELDQLSMWRDLLRDMPQGLPGNGDRGLDNTHSWARTYWGGALFCFVADIEIRRRTNGKFGLQTALRAINRDSGGHQVDWTIEQALASGDRATGTSVLSDLYRDWRAQPASPDLASLFRDLGVEERDGKVSLNDAAPLASIRASIISGMP